MTESNVFNQSFDDLLAQAGIAGGTASQADGKNDEQAPTTQPSVMSFDDILQQEGLEDVTDNPTTASATTEEPNITEEYRVTTDVFGENDKPNQLPTFDDLMAQAGGVETKDTKPEHITEAPKQEITGIPTFDDLMAQAGALDTKPQITEEVTPEVTEEVTHEVTEEVTPKVTEEVTPEVTEEVNPEVTEEVTHEATEEVNPEVKEEVKPKAKRSRAKTKTMNQPSETLIDKDTVDEINTAIHGIVRNAVRRAFKDAMEELTKSFE